MVQRYVRDLEEANVAERGSHIVMQPAEDVEPKRLPPNLASSKEVSIPAIALFEHPTPATTLFEATNGGSAGLTVTLGEPLEYGLAPNDWSIIGMQRYQGTPDTPAMNPTLVERDFASGDTQQQDYLGVFANDAAAAADSDYDLTRSQLYWRTSDRRARLHNANSDVWVSSVNQANELARFNNNYMLSFPFNSSGAVTEYSYADSAAAVAYIVATNFAAGTNNDDTRYSFDRNYVYYNQDQGKLKVITDLTPAQSATAATADMPTSATGGLRITATPAGAAGNDFYVRATASNVTGVSYNAPSKEFNVIVNNNANAQAVRNAFNSDADNQGFSMAYYGTEDGTTVISSGNVLVAGFGTRRRFSGGDDGGMYIVPAVEGEPEDPIHIILDYDNEEMEIFYNRAAGGRLSGPDEIGDIRDYINTHLPGLIAEFTGGANANTQVTRPFANRSRFSGGALSGLRVLIDEPLAFGEEGNEFTFKARERFAGGAAQAETQATIDIYTGVARRRGVRITLEAGIADVLGEDISSGALGNEWTFAVVSPTDQSTGVVIVTAAIKEITYYAHTSPEGATDTAVQLLNACNAGGTGVTAAYFGTGNTGTEQIFAGSLGRINAGQTDFTGGLDAHAGGGEAPISISVGPSNATVRIPAFEGGGVELELTDPAGAAGVGWVARGEDFEGPGSVTRDDDAREIVTRGDGSITVNSFLNHLENIAGVIARTYGGVSGTSNINTNFRLEFLGGLDGNDVEIRYAPIAKGNIANPDTMGAVKAVIDGVDGLISYYYGGANANTTASRHVPWEHMFENGRTAIVVFSAFGLGPTQNTFGTTATANRAAAEALRDDYEGRHPAWREAYRGDDQLWILLRWSNTRLFQVLHEDGTWQDISALALIGPEGPPGPAPTDARLNALIQALLSGFGVPVADFDALEQLVTALVARVTTLEGYHPQPISGANYYFGWSSTGVIATADFAAATAVQASFSGALPAESGEAFIWAGVPVAGGVPTEVYLLEESDNVFDFFERQTGVVDDGNGNDYIVIVATEEQAGSIYGGTTVRLGYER